MQQVVEYFNHPLLQVSKEIGLLTLLDEFMEGHSHMCCVVDLPLGDVAPMATVDLTGKVQRPSKPLDTFEVVSPIIGNLRPKPFVSALCILR